MERQGLPFSSQIILLLLSLCFISKPRATSRILQRSIRRTPGALSSGTPSHKEFAAKYKRLNKSN